MNESRRSDDRLRAANPVRVEDAPPPTSREARELFARIVHTRPSGTLRHRLSRRYLWVLAPIAIATAAAGTYGYLREVRQPLAYACYRQTNLAADRSVVTSDGRGPIEACGSMWRPGAEFNPEGNTDVPPLAACLLESGAIAVFPSFGDGDTCSALGLAHPVQPAERDEDRVTRLQAALVERFLGGCLTRAEAVDAVREQLRVQRLEGWRVITPVPFTDREPCASLAFDVPNRTVRVIPVLSRSSPPPG